jgi:hypothetical protein
MKLAGIRWTFLVDASWNDEALSSDREMEERLVVQDVCVDHLSDLQRQTLDEAGIVLVLVLSRCRSYA